MEQTKANNTPGILISVDLKKAFVSLEWPSIQSALKKFNFGDSKKKMGRDLLHGHRKCSFKQRFCNRLV